MKNKKLVPKSLRQKVHRIKKTLQVYAVNKKLTDKLEQTEKKASVAKRELRKLQLLVTHHQKLYSGLEELRTMQNISNITEKERIAIEIYKKEINRLQTLVENYQQLRDDDPICNSLSEIKKPKYQWTYNLKKLKTNLQDFNQQQQEYKETIKKAKQAEVTITFTRTDPIKQPGNQNSYKPENMREHTAHLQLDEKYTATYYLADIPPVLAQDSIFKLTTAPLPITISMFIEPTNNHDLIKKAKQRVAILEMKQSERVNKGKLKDEELAKSIEEITQFIYELVHEYEKGFVFACYITLVCDKKEDLKSLHKELKNLTDSLELTITKYLYDQKKAFEATLPFNDDTIKQNKILQSSAVSFLSPFVTKQINEFQGVFLGINRYHNSLVFLNPFAIDDRNINNSNINIFGQSGMGKSVTAKILANRLYMRGTQIIIIDPEGEYVSFAKALGGEVIDFSREHGMNPFSITTTDSNDILDHIGVLKTFFKFFIRPQRYDGAVLDKILVSLYKDYPEKQPTYKQFMNALQSSPMVDDLQILEKGSLKGVFNVERNIQLNNDIVVCNLAPLGETEEKAPAMYLLSSLIWYLSNQVSERKKMLFIDEAHNLLVDREVAVFYRKLVKQARKRNMGVVSITQDVQDFLDNELGKAIITNSETKILLKQSYATIPLMENIFPMTPEEKRQLGEMEIGEIVLYRQQEHLRVGLIPLPFEEKLLGIRKD